MTIPATDVAAVLKMIAPAVHRYVNVRIEAATVELKTELAELKRELQARPQSRDGRDGKDGERGPQGERGEKGIDGAPGRDGTDGAAGPKGDQGERGERGSEGPAGTPGRDGRDGAPGPMGPPGEKGIDGVNGKDGTDGRDGTLEQLQIKQLDPRTWAFCFKSGEPIEGGTFSLPLPIYRGAFADGQTYEAGDCVTWAGAMWIAKEATTMKPDEHKGEGARVWQLCVRRGRDGKEGKAGPSGPMGPRGDAGTPGRHAY